MHSRYCILSTLHAYGGCLLPPRSLHAYARYCTVRYATLSLTDSHPWNRQLIRKTKPFFCGVPFSPGFYAFVCVYTHARAYVLIYPVNVFCKCTHEHWVHKIQMRKVHCSFGICLSSLWDRWQHGKYRARLGITILQMMLVHWSILILDALTEKLMFDLQKLRCSGGALAGQTERLLSINFGLTHSWQMFYIFNMITESGENLYALSREEGSDWTLMGRIPYAASLLFWLRTLLNWRLTLSSHSCCRKLRSVRTSKKWWTVSMFLYGTVYNVQYLTERTTFKLSNTLKGSRPLSLMLYIAFTSQPARQQPLQHQ